MAKEVIHTIKLGGKEGYDFRNLISENYDVIANMHHSPDGETTYFDLELYPKGTFQKEKEPKRKTRNRI